VLATAFFSQDGKGSSSSFFQVSQMVGQPHLCSAFWKQLYGIMRPNGIKKHG